MKSIILFLILTFCTLLPVINAQEVQKELRQYRWKQIDRYHISTGFGIGANKNITTSAQLSIGTGSFRNLLIFDIGIRYEKLRMLKSPSENIRISRIPLFVSAGINFVRWDNGCLYLGGEISETFNLRALHHTEFNDVTTSDIEASKRHASVEGKMGFRIDKWDCCIFYSYDMAPAFNQKHIYETVDYDYELLHDNIFERDRVGIRIIYHFTL